MENKKLNIILITAIIIIVIVIGYMISLIVRNENSRIYFKISEIKDINWVNEEENISFKISNNSVTLDIFDINVLNNLKIEFNNQTGEIKYKQNNQMVEGMLYVRSVTNDSIIIWYNKAEYHLNKQIINK